MSGHIRKRKRKDGTFVYQARHTDPVRGLADRQRTVSFHLSKMA